MDKTMEDPPTSAVLLDHCHFSQVIFNSVEKFYVPGGDITCYYTLTQHFVPRRKDWIGIFRVGWKTTREYYTFMWVPVPVELPKESNKQQEVQFKAYYLPKDDEYYQFCYVDQDGVIRGASIPFQFRPENEEDILVVTPQGQVEEIEQHNKELYKENQALQDSCASLQKQNTELQAELQRKQEELETLQSINEKLEQKVREQDCWKTKMLQLKEHSQKLSSEKDKMSILVDQLQAQLSAQEKEMEKLIQGDQDKTELLEQMKKEKDQLFLSLSEQMEQQKQLEHTVEELKAKESRVTRKQEELTEPGDKNTTVEEQSVQEVARLEAKEENFDLLRRLSDDRILCDALQREKENLERENEHLKEENRRLMTYMGLDSDSLAYQVPPSHQRGAGQNTGLVFGNPYSGIQESSSAGLFSDKKCSTFKSDLMGDTCDHTLEQHLLTRSLRCPVCSKIFPAREKQIFEDHVLCHSL